MLLSLATAWLRSVFGKQDVLTPEDYAKAHKMDPRAVVAAAVEGRIPEGFFLKLDPELPATFEEGRDSYRIPANAAIKPRTGPLP